MLTQDVEERSSGIEGNNQEDEMSTDNNTASTPSTRGAKDAPTNKWGGDINTGDDDVKRGSNAANGGNTVATEMVDGEEEGGTGGNVEYEVSGPQ